MSTLKVVDVFLQFRLLHSLLNICGNGRPGSVDVVLDLRVDSQRDVADQSLLNDSSKLQDFKLGIVPIGVRILIDLKRISPVASATPFVCDRIDVVRMDLSVTLKEGSVSEMVE